MKDLVLKFNGENITRLAEQAGITSNHALAKESGVAAPNLYENMSGKTFPSLLTLIRLLQGVGRSLEEIQATRLDEILIIEKPSLESAPDPDWEQH